MKLGGARNEVTRFDLPDITTYHVDQLTDPSDELLETLLCSWAEDLKRYLYVSM